MNKQIKRRIADSFYFSDLDGLTIEEAIEMLSKVQERFPDKKIKIDIDLYGDYSNDSQFYYEEEETDSEYEARIKQNERWKKEAEKREREQYELLRQKYGTIN